VQTRLAFLAGRRVYRDLAELALVAVAFLLYFVVRANVVDRPEVALTNARDIVALERSLGIFVEPDWQRAILDDEVIVRFFNFVYFWLDFPLIAVLGVVLYFTRRPQYTFTRDALLISGAFALAAYFVYPVAPPRLYAAMPSLHVGWAVLVAIGVVMAFPHNRLVLALAVLHPLTQSASTVFTSNHYFLDGAGGLLAAALGLAGAIALQRWGYRGARRWLGLKA
jgi:hypothetical protein